MSTVSLYPPLAQIEQRLFAVPDDLLLRLAEADLTIPEPLRAAALADNEVMAQVTVLREALAEDWQTDFAQPTELAEPPEFIKTLIEQQVAARQADFGVFPERGQLVWLSSAPTPPGKTSDLQFATPLVVLLGRQNPDSKVWHGWLVAQEVQYAGFWDFLLQPEDEPFDPLCGMVQLWNPVQLFFSDTSKAKAVGRLSEARMQTVEALALEYVLGDTELPRVRPGFIAARPVGVGFVAVTGTPLGDGNDPRHAYQHVYHHVAALLNAPVLAWQTEPATTGADILAALYDVIAAAWRQATGHRVEPVPPVAHAMSGQADENIVVMALQDDLHLSLIHSAGKIDLTLVYTGQEQLHVMVIDGGEQACSTLLKANLPPLDYRGLVVDTDNHLLIEWANGNKINLPLKMDI